MKCLVLAAVTLGLAACASDPASRFVEGESNASDGQRAMSGDRRVSDAQKIRQMQVDLQSTNERFARQAEAERLSRRGAPANAPVDQQEQQNGCVSNGVWRPC
jgi:hypothetical protein